MWLYRGLSTVLRSIYLRSIGFETVLAKSGFTEVNVLQYYISRYLLNTRRKHGSLFPATAPQMVEQRVGYSTTYNIPVEQS